VGDRSTSTAFGNDALRKLLRHVYAMTRLIINDEGAWPELNQGGIAYRY
jgi:hypothetical protein